MISDDFKRPTGAPRQSTRDRVIDWLGAQGPSKLTVYMCAMVALVAFLADKMG